jgi:hypothetical protein
MPRPFTRAQALQNAAFVAALRRTGNARRAADELGVHRSTFTKRRARDAAFAAEWDAALAFAHAALHAGTSRALRAPRATDPRTTGGEAHVVRQRSGRLQLRRAAPGRMTQAAEQAFFAALSATANVRLSAAAAGFSHASFYARARTDPAFAREMRLALAMGYERLECALLAGMDPEAYRNDVWRRNDPPSIPQMTAAEALQLLSLHMKAAVLDWERPDRRGRRGETIDERSARRAAIWRRDRAVEAEDAAIRRADARVPVGRVAHEPPAPLVWLEGRGKVDGRPAEAEAAEAPVKTRNGRVRKRKEGRAMFGGWRLGDL